MKPWTRRAVLHLGVAVGIASQARPILPATTTLPTVIAYRNPGCGCCEMCARHLRRAGFEVTMNDDPHLAARQTDLGVPEVLRGCHTATVGRYVIEGHVPAPDILRLLKNQPNAKGLAVPGMPASSPGMETLGVVEKYDVLLFRADGSSQIFRRTRE
jgi:hypothetical protein